MRMLPKAPLELMGKPKVFMPYSGGVRGYRRILQKCAQDGYTGFTLRKQPAALGGTATHLNHKPA